MEPSEHDPTEKTVDHSDRTPDTHYGRALTFHSIPPTRPSTLVNLNSSFFGSTPSDTLPATKQFDDPHIALHTSKPFYAPASSSQFRSESSRIISPLRSNAERPERASLLSPQPLTQHNLISALQNCASNSSPHSSPSQPHHNLQQVPQPRNTRSNRIDLSSPNKQPNSSILPSEYLKQGLFWNHEQILPDPQPTITLQSTAFARPPRPPQDLRDRINPPPNSSPRRTSMEREEECPHSPPKEGIVTQKEKDTKSGLAKMFGWLTGWGKNTKPKSKSAEIKQTAKKKEKEDKDDKIGKSKPKEPEERSETTGTSDTPKPLIEPGEVSESKSNTQEEPQNERILEDKVKPGETVTKPDKSKNEEDESLGNGDDADRMEEKEELVRKEETMEMTPHSDSPSFKLLSKPFNSPPPLVLPARTSQGQLFASLKSEKKKKIPLKPKKKKKREQDLSREIPPFNTPSPLITSKWETFTLLKRSQSANSQRGRASKTARRWTATRRSVSSTSSTEDISQNPEHREIRKRKRKRHVSTPPRQRGTSRSLSPPTTPTSSSSSTLSFNSTRERMQKRETNDWGETERKEEGEEDEVRAEKRRRQVENLKRIILKRESKEEDPTGGEQRNPQLSNLRQPKIDSFFLKKEPRFEEPEDIQESPPHTPKFFLTNSTTFQTNIEQNFFFNQPVYYQSSFNQAMEEGMLIDELASFEEEMKRFEEERRYQEESLWIQQRRMEEERTKWELEQRQAAEDREKHTKDRERMEQEEKEREKHTKDRERMEQEEKEREKHTKDRERMEQEEKEREKHTKDRERMEQEEKEREKHTKDRERMEQEEKEREKHTKDRERMEQEDREVHQKGEEEIQKETGEWLNELEASLRERMPRLKGKPTKETPRITETERVGKKQKDVDKSEREKGTLRKLLEEQEEVKRRKKIQEEERTAEKKRREREKMEVREEKTMIVDRRTGRQRDHNEERNPTEVPKRRNEEDMEELRSPNTILRENREDEVLETTISKLIDMNKLLKNENLNNLLRSLDIAEEGKQRRVYRWGTEKREKVKALGETLTVDILPIIGLLQYNTSEVNKKKLGELKQPDIEEIKNTTVPREPFTFVASKAWLEITQTKKEEKTTQRNQKPKKEYERRTDESRREKESRFQSAVETFEPGRGQSLPNTLHIPIPTFRRPAPSVRANTSTLEPFKVDQGYTTWNEDLTSQHVHKAESLFLHHLATITESLKKEEWNKEEVNRTAWGMSNIPHELKKEKKRKRQAEERKRTGNEVTIRERTKWEGLIGRGKTGSVAKEIERRSIENTDLPEEEVRKQIRGLHDSTDEKELWIPETTAGREIVRGGEQAEVEQAINKLNSNSTPSMDGITAELIKRLCSRNRNLGTHLTNTIQLCLQKSFRHNPTPCPPPIF
ncbi:hypothetical protein BLNAU_13600 [Blattamonas nauphoetae]|uniref:Trichohyalin-like n=1 Tax=Blattamonas nauphoetae TaxID=2049346 RepID=A0ABQ9XG43_9EUKA|nr:hypothetical protein BLNAU_13600 [Blattamonas nauphoetae]